MKTQWNFIPIKILGVFVWEIAPPSTHFNYKAFCWKPWLLFENTISFSLLLLRLMDQKWTFSKTLGSIPNRDWKKKTLNTFYVFLMLKLCKTILSQFDCFSRRFKIKLSKWKFVQKYQSLSLLNFKINVLVPTNFILLVNLFWNFYVGLNSI